MGASSSWEGSTVARDLRRLLALFWTLFAMALCSSAAHAGSFCAAGTGSGSAALCESLTSARPLVLGMLVLGMDGEASSDAARAATEVRAIDLAERSPALGMSDLQLGSAWGVSGNDEVALASTR
jgi:hypothetical protein